MDLVGSKIQNEKQGSETWDELQLASIIKKEIWGLQWKKRERANNSTEIYII